jgi:hypothetical protein
MKFCRRLLEFLKKSRQIDHISATRQQKIEF